MTIQPHINIGRDISRAYSNLNLWHFVPHFVVVVVVVILLIYTQSLSENRYVAVGKI